MREVWVSAGVLVTEQKALVARRPEGKSMAGLWEFPGGKLEQGETAEEALVRELREELGIMVAVEDLEPFYTVSHRYPEFQLEMPVFLCRRWEGEPQAITHSELMWCPLERLAALAMPEADKPLIPLLQRLAKERVSQ